MPHVKMHSEKWLSSDNTLENKIIPFHVPLVTSSESDHVIKAIQNKHLAAEGYYSVKCASFLEKFTMAMYKSIMFIIIDIISMFCFL